MPPRHNVTFKLLNAFFRLSGHAPSWTTWNTTPMNKDMTEDEFTVTRLTWFKVLMLVNPLALRSMVTSHFASPDANFSHKDRMYPSFHGPFGDSHAIWQPLTTVDHVDTRDSSCPHSDSLLLMAASDSPWDYVGLLSINFMYVSIAASAPLSVKAARPPAS